MAIVEEKSVVSEDGIKKGIDQNSMGMALDILQRGLYAHPIESTVRELASNAYDAVIERDVAKAILNGTTPVEDHFDVTKVDGIFHASGWEPDYFDPKWLSDDPNVNIFYEEGKLKDTLRVVDYGVGLGKNRMVGYFQLNYSSKRANKDSLGRFGLGSKVALSLGVDSFRVITKYNGRKFKFDVYLDKVDSIVSKFGDNGMNEYVELPTGRFEKDEEGNDMMDAPIMYKAYYEPTTEKNGLELIVEVKKHNKKRFFEAVESQLMYMPKIKFLHKSETSITHKDVPIRAEIMYRDRDIVISKSNIYNKPHILLGTGEALINYGFIAFNELEIEAKPGAVGLILDINDIEVTPSREAAIWSTKTRAAVLKKYEAVKATATKFVNDELANEKDFVQWLIKASSTLNAIRSGNSSGHDTISKLASIIDINDVKDISFPGDKTIKFPADNFDKFFSKDYNIRVVQYSSYEKKVVRTKITDPGSLSLPIFRSTGDRSAPLRDRFIYDTHGKFVLITQKPDAIVNKHTRLLINAKDVKPYDTVVVPEDIIQSYMATDMDDSDIDEAVVAKYDRAALRKQNQQIVVHEAQKGYPSYSFTSKEYAITDILAKQSDGRLIYDLYGNRQDMLDILAACPANINTLHTDWHNDNLEKHQEEVFQRFSPNRKSPNFYLVAADNLKHVESNRAFVKLADYVVEKVNKKTGELTFSGDVKLMATLSMLNELLNAKLDKNPYLNRQVNNITRVFTNKHMEHIDPVLQEKYTKFFEVFAASSAKPVNYLKNASSFWSHCIELHAMRAKLLPLNETREEELLTLLDWEIPGYLCDKLEDVIIKDIDILDVEFINDILSGIEVYEEHLDVLCLFGEAYIAVDSHAKALGEKLKTLLTNDAIIQQPDNPQTSGQVG